MFVTFHRFSPCPNPHSIKEATKAHSINPSALLHSLDIFRHWHYNHNHAKVNQKILTWNLAPVGL
jgi:hypothetical protein